MRFLIVAAAVFACAAAAPSGALLATSYSAGIFSHGAPLAYAAAPVAVAHAAPLAVAHAAPLAVAHAAPVAVSTIPSGDIQGAAIDAHVKAADHIRAAADQVSEIQGKAINAAEDHAWQAVDAVQTAAAQIDGAAASVAPEVARQLVGHGAAVVAAPVAAYAAPAVVAPIVAAPTFAARAIATPLIAAHGFAPAPVAYAAHGLVHAY